MALPTTAETREFNNFADNGDGSTSRFAFIKGGVGSIIAGVTFDAITVAYPTSTTEVYSYKTGGTGGMTVATVTITYTTSSKNTLLSVVRT